MILSDREMRLSMERRSVTVEPLPPAARWSSTALDLTLDTELLIWRPDGAGDPAHPIAPGSHEFNYTELVRDHAIRSSIAGAGHVLGPGEFVLGWTVEKIQLPHRSRLAARVEGKSSLARLGLGVHVTAPTIHSGFGFDPSHPEKRLPLQLEIWNIGPLHLRLTAGMAICQLVFEEVHGTPEKGYAGLFVDQGSKA